MTSCVLDASVAAKWLLPAANEGLLDQANRLAALHVKRELQLLAPDLIEAEIGNVLWKAVRRNRISRANAEKSMRHFVALRSQLFPLQICWNRHCRLRWLAIGASTTAFMSLWPSPPRPNSSPPTSGSLTRSEAAFPCAGWGLCPVSERVRSLEELAWQEQ